MNSIFSAKALVVPLIDSTLNNFSDKYKLNFIIRTVSYLKQTVAESGKYQVSRRSPVKSKKDLDEVYTSNLSVDSSYLFKII